VTAARRRLALLAAAIALPGWAGAPPDDWASPDGGFKRASAQGAELSAEDREVVENLDLLESLDDAGDLDLLLDLAEEE